MFITVIEKISCSVYLKPGSIHVRCVPSRAPLQNDDGHVLFLTCSGHERGSELLCVYAYAHHGNACMCAYVHVHDCGSACLLLPQTRRLP